jgi:phosphopantothenoylcysteine decarboxylase/phosphopantothenate--cysteine ligase
MLPWKNNRRVLLGVSGGIAAYKAAEIVRLLRHHCCDVEVVLTEDAERFVSPLTLSTLSGRRTWRQQDYLSSDYGYQIPHILLADWAEAVVTAPATANTIAGLAQGTARSLLESVILATRAPVLIFPAMNVHMLENAATQDNIGELRRRGIRVAEPAEGALACGYEGKGRLPSPEVILQEIWRLLCPKKDLSSCRVLVTSGPTWEFLDPVRFIGNPSSGKMGRAVARTAWYRGGDVTIVEGPVSLEAPYGIERVPVISALDMYEAVLSRAGENDVIVKAAAVGDFRPETREEGKVKREGRDRLTISLVQNPDIARELGVRKRKDQILVGFAAESSDLIVHASEKIRRKGLDFIVANDITAEGAGFGADTNRVVFLFPDGTSRRVEGAKEDVADVLWDLVSSLRCGTGN